MKKNIVFLVKNIYNRGGDTRAVTLIANKLSHNYNIKILSLFKTSEYTKFELNNEISVHNLFEKPFSIRKNYFKVIKAFNEFVRNNHLDLILIEAVGFNCFTYPVLKNFPEIKTLTVEHASLFDGGKIFGLAWFGRKIACNHNDCVVVLTKRDLMDYKSHFKNINRIEQIYNPIDEKIIKYEYNFSSKKIISCGRLVAVKGFDILMDIARKVFDVHPDWQWHIYGEGIERGKLQDKISQLNLERNVFLMGEIDNIYEKYRDYSFYVMTSRKESFGMVLLEAIKSGIPVISFNCENGPAEIIKDDINGYLIPPFDVERMAKRICQLIENPSLRGELSFNTEKSIEKFNLENISGKWDEIIRSLI